MTPKKANPLPNESMEWELGISYTSLVKRIAEAEMSKKPLGIFRPGIFKLFKEIVKLKASKKVQGVIMYTNNGSLPLVNFVRDVFHYAVKNPVFDGVYYFHNTLRTKDVYGKPSPNKNWVELKRLLKDIGSPDLEPKDVMFFDDQMHPHLTAVLGSNYIKVNPYTYKVPNERVFETYHKALKDSDLLSDMNKADFFNYVKSCTFDKVATNAENHLELLTDEGRIPNVVIPVNNVMSSTFMSNAIKRMISKANNLEGGKRTTRKRKSSSKNLTVWTRY